MTHPYNHAERVKNRVVAEQQSLYRGRKAMGQVELYRKPDYLVGKKYPKMSGVYSDERDDRQMLLRLGAGEIGATLAIPYLPCTPRVSDPDAQGVIKIIECIQRGLNQLGCQLKTDGFLGAKSTHCLKQVAGRSWHDKSWLQLMGDVIGAIDAGLTVRPPSGGTSMQGLGFYQDLGQTADAWCSAANPQPGCQVRSGICLPMNVITLAKFKELQSQLNRLAHVNKWSKIDVDGRIGPKTLALLAKVGMGYPDCDGASKDAAQLALAAKANADRLGAPASVSAPVLSRPSKPRGDGGVDHPSETNWPLIALGAAAVGGAYWYMKKRKPAKRTKKKKR